ncbi:hypothetical protein [Splendidivirga corallicola]|uniref:hypothetical protein n=1 Tax=Splendidivirga corallicola TaxID=3051826 RepID=UPI003211BB87
MKKYSFYLIAIFAIVLSCQKDNDKPSPNESPSNGCTVNLDNVTRCGLLEEL